MLDLVQLNELNESHLHTGKSLADAVIDSGLIERGDILAAVAKYLGYDYLDSPPNKIDESVASTVRASVARMYAVVTYEVDDTSVALLAKDPFNPAIIDDLTFTLNKDITIVVCDPAHMDSLLIATYGEEIPRSTTYSVTLVKVSLSRRMIFRKVISPTLRIRRPSFASSISCSSKRLRTKPLTFTSSLLKTSFVSAIGLMERSMRWHPRLRVWPSP